MIAQNESVTIKRSQINLAGYNPRKITGEAKARLRDNLKKMGLMGGLVWNVRTGNLVSGHQRLTILDQENGYKKGNADTDYDVTVTKVDLSEQDEKAQNVFFNNQAAMGFFDEAKLDDLMKSIDFSEMTGFSKQAQTAMFTDTSLTDDEYAEVTQKAAELSKQAKEMHKNTGKDFDANYVVLVFKNRDDKTTLIDNMGIPLDDGRFCNGEEFLQKMQEMYSGGEE